MKSTIALPDGSRLTITTIHPAQALCIAKTYSDGLTKSFHVPVEFAGVFAQAIERAGRVVETGPCSRPNPAALAAVPEFVKGTSFVGCTGNCNQGRNCTCGGRF